MCYCFQSVSQLLCPDDVPKPSAQWQSHCRRASSAPGLCQLVVSNFSPHVEGPWTSERLSRFHRGGTFAGTGRQYTQLFCYSFGCSFLVAAWDNSKLEHLQENKNKGALPWCYLVILTYSCPFFAKVGGVWSKVCVCFMLFLPFAWVLLCH